MYVQSVENFSNLIFCIVRFTEHLALICLQKNNITMQINLGSWSVMSL